jgi:hypothetical protein
MASGAASNSTVSPPLRATRRSSPSFLLKFDRTFALFLDCVCQKASVVPKVVYTPLHLYMIFRVFRVLEARNPLKMLEIKLCKWARFSVRLCRTFAIRDDFTVALSMHGVNRLNLRRTSDIQQTSVPTTSRRQPRALQDLLPVLFRFWVYPPQIRCRLTPHRSPLPRPVVSTS